MGIGEGVRWVCDRYDDDMWLGEKPRTTLWEERASTLVSDPTVRVALWSLSGLLKGAVDEDDSEE